MDLLTIKEESNEALDIIRLVQFDKIRVKVIEKYYNSSFMKKANISSNGRSSFSI